MAANTEHIFNNEAYARIKAGISDAATSIELYPGHAQIFLAGWVSGKEFYATITNAQADIEIVKVAAISGDTLTVERGQDGTVAQEWKSGAIITQRLVAANLEGFIQREAFREVYYNPNSILTADYPGEKVYQSLNQRIWWKNKTGTIWQAIAGSLAGWLAYPYDPISYASISLRGICWSPALELFCAVGSEGIVCSDNGIDWTPVPMPGLSFQCVCWSPELDLFVAVGDNNVATSPDAVTWTPRIPAAAYLWKSVCWSPEKNLFVVVAAESQDFACMTSPDGITWTLRETPHSADEQWQGVCWAPSISKFCAVPYGASGLPHCMLSSNGGA